MIVVSEEQLEGGPVFLYEVGFVKGQIFLECRIGNCQLCQGSYLNALGIFGCVCLRRRGEKRVC